MPHTHAASGMYSVWCPYFFHFLSNEDAFQALRNLIVNHGIKKVEAMGRRHGSKFRDDVDEKDNVSLIDGNTPSLTAEGKSCSKT